MAGIIPPEMGAGPANQGILRSLNQTVITFKETITQMDSIFTVYIYIYELISSTQAMRGMESYRNSAAVFFKPFFKRAVETD